MSVVQVLLSGLTVLAAFAALSVTDPTGDSVGDGTIVAPTAPRYANSAIFDLHDVALTSQPVAAAGADPATTPVGAGTSDLRVTLGAIDTSESTAVGFGSVVLDVYLDAEPGGHDVTLVGPDMLFPTGLGWEYAVRVTPDGATGYVFAGQGDASSDAAGGVLVAEPGAVEEALDGDDASSGADPDDLDEIAAGPEQESLFDSVPVAVFIDGATIVIELPWALPESTVMYALTGVHDPFNPSGWRPLAATPSPWAYSGGEQVVPVIDLLAPDQDAQVRALRTGVLPQPSVPAGSTGVLWLVFMGVGVAVALAGLLLRRRVPAPAIRGRTTGLPPDPDAEPVGARLDQRPAQRAPQRPHQRPAEPAVAVPLPPRVRTDDDAPRWAPVQVSVDAETVASTPDAQESARDGDGAPESATESAEQPEPGEPPEAAKDAPTPVTGNSAFDSYVLYGSDDDYDDDDDAEGFDELTKGDEQGAAS